MFVVDRLGCRFIDSHFSRRGSNGACHEDALDQDLFLSLVDFFIQLPGTFLTVVSFQDFHSGVQV